MMKSKYKILFLFLLALNYSCKGQPQIESNESAIYIDAEDLKGPIKSVFTYYDYVKDSLKFERRGPFKDQKRNFIFYNVDIGAYRYIEFDSKHRKTSEILVNGNWFDKNKKIQEWKYKRYDYNEEDWETLNKVILKKRPSYPVNSDVGYYQLLRVSYNLEQPLYGLISSDSSELSSYIHKYNIDNNKIKEKREYYLRNSNIQELDERELYCIILFKYDNKENLIRQDIKAGEYGKTMPFHGMNTESGFCEDLHLAYEYDAKDRLTKAVFFGCGDTLATQEFTYHPTKDYVTKMKRYVGGVGGDFQVTKNTVFHYDEYGSIIQRDYVPKEGQDLGLPVSTYYKYDYDKYHNWYKCYIYMEGTKEGEPTAIITRELEYYEN